MTYKEIYDKVMPESKRREEKYNILPTILLRPLSIYMTMPLLNTKITPTTITKISVANAIIGFILLGFGKTMPLKVLGWFFFLLWDLLDGIDGNLARCTNQCSPLGDLWDTTGGYAAMVLIYFSSGIAAFYDTNSVNFLEPYWFLIIGGTTAICSIFPRLVMHKKKSSAGNTEVIKSLSDKKSFGLTNIIAMNFVSPAGFMQLFLLLAIIFHLLNLFIFGYAIINIAVMSLSLYKLLRE